MGGGSNNCTNSRHVAGTNWYYCYDHLQNEVKSLEVGSS